MLLLANYRVMHGREPFEGPRLLHRAWIWTDRCNGVPESIQGSFVGTDTVSSILPTAPAPPHGVLIHAPPHHPQPHTRIHPLPVREADCDGLRWLSQDANGVRQFGSGELSSAQRTPRL